MKDTLKKGLGLATLALVVAGVVRELRKPPAERTWQGYVLGFVPYDFRPPTPARLKEAFWNPRDERLFTPRPFGVGWGINFYQAWRMAGGSI